MHKTDLKLYKQMKTSVFALYKLICDEYIDLKCDKITVENCVKEHTLKDTSSAYGVQCNKMYTSNKVHLYYHMTHIIVTLFYKSLCSNVQTYSSLRISVSQP